MDAEGGSAPRAEELGLQTCSLCPPELGVEVLEAAAPSIPKHRVSPRNWPRTSPVTSPTHFFRVRNKATLVASPTIFSVVM